MLRLFGDGNPAVETFEDNSLRRNTWRYPLPIKFAAVTEIWAHFSGAVVHNTPADVSLCGMGAIATPTFPFSAALSSPIKGLGRKHGQAPCAELWRYH